MGWSFNLERGGFKETLRDLSAAEEHVFNGVKITRVCLAKCFRGNIRHKGNFWTLWERAVFCGDDKIESNKYIVLFLMRCHGGCWGWKDVDETMGPCEINCPESYIRRASPPVNEWARSWREQSLAWNQSRRRRRADGKRPHLIGGVV